MLFKALKTTTTLSLATFVLYLITNQELLNVTNKFEKSQNKTLTKKRDFNRTFNVPTKRDDYLPKLTFLSNKTSTDFNFNQVFLKTTTKKKHFKNVKILKRSFEKANNRKAENIFFIETGDSISNVALNARQMCAIESAALTNPTAIILFLFTSQARFKRLKITPQLRSVLSYPNVQLNFLNVEEFASGSPMENFIKSGILSDSDFLLPHKSDVMRLLVLWKLGGTYLDMDVIVKKSFRSTPANFACSESENFMNGAVLNFSSEERKNLSEVFIKDLIKNFDGSKYSQNGPLLITRVVKNLCDVQNLNEINATRDCRGFHVLKTDQCYPIPYEDWSNFMIETNSEDVMKKVENSVVVHFWNKFSKTVKIKLSSKAPYIQLARKFCPKTISTCKTFF